MLGQMKFQYSLDYGLTWVMMHPGINNIGTLVIINNDILMTSVSIHFDLCEH